MVILKEITVLTTQYNQWIRITDEIERLLAESGVQNGIINVISRHTTTGVTVNESLECLESDMSEFLSRLAPEDWPYAHARCCGTTAPRRVIPRDTSSP